MVIQKPPTAQNYAVGCSGIIGVGPFSHRSGYIEGPNRLNLQPSSLYEAQLYARLNNKAESVITDLPKLEESQLVSVYPNPTGGILYVNSTQQRIDLSYKVFDLRGGEMLNGNLGIQNQIDISALPNGLYLLYIQSETGEIVKKVSKIGR